MKNMLSRHFHYIKSYILPQSLRSQMLIVVLGGVFLGIFISTIIHITGDSSIIRNATVEMETALYRTTYNNLIHELLLTQNDLVLRRTQMTNDLKMLADMTQKIIDNKEALQPLIDTAASLPYLEDRLHYNSETRHSQNEPEEHSVVSVQYIFHDDTYTIHSYTKEVIEYTALLDLAMPSVHKYGAKKLWTYFVGGYNASFVRMTPWNDYEGTLEFYPNHMDQEYWDYWPGLVREWERLLADESVTDYTTAFTSYIDGPSGHLVTTFAYPVWNKERTHLAGAMWIDIELQDLMSYIEHLELGDTGFAFLAEENGNVFAVNDYGAGVLDLDTTQYFLANFDLRRSFRDSSISEIANLQLPISDAIHTDYLTIHDSEYLLLALNLPPLHKLIETKIPPTITSYRWTLYFLVPIDNIYQPVNEMKARFKGHSLNILFIQLCILAIIIPILIFMTFRITSNVISSLTSLSRGTQQISSGDYDAQVSVTSDGEVGKLGKTFNEMSLQIKKGFEHIEQQNAALKKEIYDRDVTEKALQESEAQYKRLADNAPDIIYKFSFHPEPGFDFISPAVTAITGYTPQDHYDDPSLGLKMIHPDDRARLEDFTKGILPQSPQTVRWIRKDGKTIWIEDRHVPLFDENGHPIAIEGIARDITEQKKAQNAIIRAKQEWERTFDTMPDLITIMDENHTIVRMNQSMAKRLHVDPGFYVGHNCYECIHNSDAPILNCPHDLLMQDHQEHHSEVYEKNLGGYFLVTASPIFDDHNNLVGSVHVARDITARKLAEEALTESENKFRSIIEATPLGMHMYTLNANEELIFTEANSAADMILGVDNSQFIGKTIVEAFPYTANTNIIEHYTNAAKYGTPWSTQNVEYVGKIQDKHVQEYYDVHAFQTEQGKMVAMFENITQRRRAELQLQEREENLRVTLNSIGDAVVATDTHGHITRMNPIAQKLSGISLEHALGKQFKDIFTFIHEKTHEPLLDPVTEILRTNTSVPLDDHAMLVSQHGRVIAISDSAAPIQDTHGKITGTVMVFRDKTKERLAQRFIEIRLHLIEYSIHHTLQELLTRALDEISAFANSPIAFYHFVKSDQETLSLQQWSTQTLEEFCTVDTYEQHYPMTDAGVWVDAVKEKKAIIHNDYNNLPHKRGMPEGHAEIIRELVVPVMRANNVVAILGIGNKQIEYTDEDAANVSYLADVTWEIVEQKRAQETIKRERDKAQQYLDIAGVIFVALDKNGFVTLINQRGCEILGYTYDDIIGKNWFENFIPHDVNNQVYSTFLKIIESKDPNNVEMEYFENEILRKDGTKRIVAWHNINLSENNTIIGTLSSGEDITEQKRYQEELARSVEQYQDLYDNAPDMYVSVNSETAHVTQCNDTLIQATGYSREEIINHPVFNLYHPDSIDDAHKAFEIFVKTGVVKNAYLQLKRKDGSKIDVSLNVSSVIDENNIRHSRSSWRDITEQKKAEKALRESQEQFMKLTQAPFEGIAITDKGIILNVNDQLADMLGYYPEDMVGMEVIKYVAPESRDMVITQMQDKQVKTYEHLALRKDGTTFPVEVQGKSLPYKEHTVRVTAIRDITDRKKAEEDLKQLNETLEHKVIERTNTLKKAMSTLMEEEKMAALGKLVAGIVHEINTPNGVALTATSFLQEAIISIESKCDKSKDDSIHNDMKGIHKACDMILSNLSSANEIITNFKQLAVDQSFEHYREINVEEYIKSILLSLYPTFKKHTYTIKYVVHNNGTFTTYPGALSQILSNLIINSVKHAFNEDDSGTIIILITLQDTMLELTYIDDGCGMSENVLRHLYEPFFTTARGKGGSGLGMNIVYNLVTSKFGGTISCQSKMNKGTMFSITIPEIDPNKNALIDAETSHVDSKALTQ